MFLAALPGAPCSHPPALRVVFTQHSRSAVEEQWDQVGAMLIAKLPRAAELMATAREDVLEFRHFPHNRSLKLWSTNLLERVNGEIPTPTRSPGRWGQYGGSRTITGNSMASGLSPSIQWPQSHRRPRSSAAESSTTATS